MQHKLTLTKDYYDYHQIMNYFQKEYGIDQRIKRKFWHWIVDEFDTLIFNGCYIDFNPYDYFMEDGESFDLNRDDDIVTVLELWYNEFGDEDMELLIEW